jgi:hypothetical protein
MSEAESASERDRTTALGLCHFLLEMHARLPAERFATLAQWLSEHQKANPAVWGLPVYHAPAGLASPPPSYEGKPTSMQITPSQITPPAKCASQDEVAATGKKGSAMRRPGRQHLGPVRLGIDDIASAAASSWRLPSDAQIEGLADALGFDGCAASSIALLAAAAAGGGTLDGAAGAKRARKPLAPIQTAKRARASKSPAPGEAQEEGDGGDGGDGADEAEEEVAPAEGGVAAKGGEPSINAGASLLLALRY